MRSGDRIARRGAHAALRRQADALWQTVAPGSACRV